MEAIIIEQAKAKITKEISEYEDLKRENGIGVVVPSEERKGLEEFLFQAVESEEGLAELVIAPEKSILKGLAWCGKQIPQKIKEHQMAVIDNQTVYSWFLDYFRWDEAKEEAERKAKAEARKKDPEVKKLQEDHQKYLAEIEAKRKAAEEAKKEKEEQKKREKLGICDGQLDLFSFLEQPAAEVSDPEPVQSAESSSEDFCTEVSDQEQHDVFDLFSFPDSQPADGLTAEDRASDFADEGGDLDV